MAYIVTPVAANITGEDIEWTPLVQRCECVIEWGWNSKIANPASFMEWCSLVVFQRCPWHDLSVGTSINTDDAAMIMAGGSDGGPPFAARRATGPAIELGRRLTADLIALATRIKATRDPSELLSQIPMDERKWLPDDDAEAADHWVFEELMTIILNRGFSAREYIHQLAQARKAQALAAGDDSGHPAPRQRTQEDRARRSKSKPKPPMPEQRKLFQLSGNRCAFETCRRVLTADETSKDRLVSLSDVAHIVAQSPKGPRGDVPMTARERDQYENLILLCKHHHDLVDKQRHTYTPECLRDMKAKHEAWVQARLDGDDVNPALLQWFIGDADDFPVVSTVDSRALLGIHPAIQLPDNADPNLTPEYPPTSSVTSIRRSVNPFDVANARAALLPSWAPRHRASLGAPSKLSAPSCPRGA